METGSLTSLLGIGVAFLGVLFMVIILLGGFKWMISSGNDDKISEAKRLVVSGVIGLAVVLSAYGITMFILANLQNAST